MQSHKPDPAGEFAAARSLYEHILNSHSVEEITDSHEGQDNVMRRVMTLARAFELWACQHVDFVQLRDPWPYVLDEGFGAAVFEVWDASSLYLVDHLIGHELEIAKVLNLPLLDPPRDPFTKPTVTQQPE